MSERIYKYKLKVTGKRQTIDMPEGAKILSVQFQEYKLVLWAVVNPERPNKPRYIEVYETGHTLWDVNCNRIHLGSAQTADYNSAHVFELVEQ